MPRRIGYKVSEVTKYKISTAIKGRKYTETHCAALSKVALIREAAKRQERQQEGAEAHVNS